MAEDTTNTALLAFLTISGTTAYTPKWKDEVIFLNEKTPPKPQEEVNEWGVVSP